MRMVLGFMQNAVSAPDHCTLLPRRVAYPNLRRAIPHMHHPASQPTLEVPTAPPPVRPLDPELRAALLTDVEEQGQITVHCTLRSEWADMVRIWPSTYLICSTTGQRSRLLHAEGITYAPLWQPLPPGSVLHFTLVFEPLPKHCILFDLVEEIPDPGGFHCPSILRNTMDLYHVEL